MPLSQFDFHGVGVHAESDEQAFLQSVEHDFSYFLAPMEEAAFHVTYENRQPDYDRLPELTCSLATPRNICFSDGSVAFIDYFGQGLNIYDTRENRCRIITEDLELAHEIAYLTILSRVSEALERKRLHRIHGLGIESAGRGTIVLLPSGGGKSTLALALLRRNHTIRLISEDSPLLTKDGKLLPFPLRIGIHPKNLPADVDSRFTRLDKRIEFSSKINIDIRYFGEQVCRRPTPASFLLLGVRSTGRRAQITPVSRRAVLRHVLMNSIIGVGLYQGLEFLLQKNFSESVRYAGIMLSRVRNNLVLLRHVRVFRFVIGRDEDQNCECLQEFLLRPEEKD